MKILMFFPGHIEHLPPLITAAKTMSDLGADINIVATSANDYTQNYFKRNNIKISVLDNSHPNNKIIRGLNRLKIISLLIHEKKQLKPDFLWFHGPFSCKYSLIPNIANNVRLIYHAYELCTNEKFLKLMHYHLISISEIVIVPEKNRLNFLSNKFNQASFYYIPNIPNTDILNCFDSSDTREIFQNNGGSDKCTNFFIYQGFFMEERCLSEIIEAFKLIKDDNVGLILIGGPQNNTYYIKLKELTINDDRIIIMPRIDYPHHLSITKGCIAGFLLYSPNKLNNIYCAPNKIYEYTSLGLGVIYSNSPSLNYLKSFSVGYSCNPLDILSINEAIQKLLNLDYEKLKERSLNFYKQVPQPSFYYYPLYNKLLELNR